VKAPPLKLTSATSCPFTEASFTLTERPPAETSRYGTQRRSELAKWKRAPISACASAQSPTMVPSFSMVMVEPSNCTKPVTMRLKP